MKTTKRNLTFKLLLACLLPGAAFLPPPVSAQGTAFTYQGRLNLDGAPANGSYDFQFILFDTDQFGFPAAPILTNASVSVNNGLFTTTLDFGAGVFTGTNYWLDVSVRTNGSGGFTDLSPRQPITPAPYAMYAMAAESLSGVLANNLMQNGVSLGTISGGGGNVIQAGANYSTIGGGGNNSIQTGADHSTIGGGSGNNIVTGAYESFVGGGQNNYIYAHWSAIGGGLFNTIFTNADYSCIGGGLQNQIQTNSSCSTIGGGSYNLLQANSAYSVIGGGYNNTIQTNSFYSVIGGGRQNTIQSNAPYATIAGGVGNSASGVAAFVGGGGYDGFDGGVNVASGSAAVIVGGVGNRSGGYDSFIGAGVYNIASAQDAVVCGGGENIASAVYATIGGGAANTNNGYSATVGGGYANTASGNYSAVAGGYYNIASGNYSFAAGQQAQATNVGAFVWADSQNATFSSTANDQFLVRAAGGVGINNNNPNGASLRVGGNRIGGWNSPVVQFENTSTASGSSPALRLVVDGGNAPDGVLNVSDNGTGPIAEFGNGIGFVASVENDGTIISKGVVLTSDRNAKENFTTLDPLAVLDKVQALPVTEWNYKDDAAGKKHIGPVAQDFHAAFGLDGADDRHISVVDEGGVALAAIQGLNQKLEQKEKEIVELKQQLEKLEQEMNQKLNGGTK